MPGPVQQAAWQAGQLQGREQRGGGAAAQHQPPCGGLLSLLQHFWAVLPDRLRHDGGEFR